MQVLVGLTVEAVEVEAVTRSLILELSGGFQVRTFVSDPTEDLDWHIDDWALRLSLEGCSRGLELIPRKD